MTSQSHESDDLGLWYVRDRGRTEGPYAIDVLRTMVQTKRIARHHHVSQDQVTWRRAIEALPADVFGLKHAVPEPNPPETPPLIDGPWGQTTPPLPPPEGTRWTAALGPAILMIVAGGGIICVGALFWVISISIQPGDERLTARITPSLVTLQGLHPSEGKTECFGLIISKQLIVAPFIAATLRNVKAHVEHTDGDLAWHSAYLVTVDPVNKTCVLRSDLGSKVSYLEPPEDKSLPPRAASLRLLRPDRNDRRALEWGTFESIMNSDQPDEMLLIGFDHTKDAHDAPLGRTVVNLDGTLVALVVDRTPAGDNICVPAHEIRTKRREAAGLPADQIMDPIELPSPPPAVAADSRQQTTPDAEEPDQANPNMKPSPKPSSGDQAAPKKQSTEVEENPRVLKGTALDAVTGLATTAIETVDQSLPELPPEKSRELGRTHLKAVLKEHPAIRDGKRPTAARRITDEIIQAAGLTPQKFTVTIVEDDTINAYAFVGQNIVINSGFLDFADGDADMIRFVLAHEVGHIVEGHTDLPFRRQLLTESLAGVGTLASDAIQTILKNSPYNRAQEEEADCFAVRMLRGCNRSTEGGVRFFRKMAAQASTDANGRKKSEDDSIVTELFNSHPDDARRIELLTGSCEDR